MSANNTGKNPDFQPRKAERRKKVSHKVFFPLELADGQVIHAERRSSPDRRANAFVTGQTLFQEVTWECVESLLQECPVIDLAPGEVLLSPEQDNQNLYLVRHGRLLAHLDAPDADGGFPIEAGEFTGDMSIIDGKRPSAYVVADDVCRVIAVHKDIFWNSVMKDPTVARNMMAMFAERIRLGNEAALIALEQELKYQHLEKELAAANSIQLSMLPRLPILEKHDSLKVHAYMKAARDVGGDFYDVIQTDDNTVYLVIGDVSGKGMPAALFMVKAMTLIRDAIFRSPDPGQVAFMVNNALCENNNSNMFATIFLAMLEIDSGHLNYIYAGHNAVYLGNGSKGYRALPKTRGLLMGVMDDAEFEVGEADLNSGEMLVLYTDGVTEAENQHKEILGDQRFIQALLGESDNSPETLVNAVLTSLSAHVGEAAQSDDITLLVVHRH